MKRPARAARHGPRPADDVGVEALTVDVADICTVDNAKTCPTGNAFACRLYSRAKKHCQAVGAGDAITKATERYYERQGRTFWNLHN